jgi:nitrogen fixation protein FixH
VQAGDRAVVISLPLAQAADAHGSVTLYRPSDASADRVLALKADEGGRQRIALDGLRPGLWSVRVRWIAQSREFYVEQRIFVR